MAKIYCSHFYLRLFNKKDGLKYLLIFLGLLALLAGTKLCAADNSAFRFTQYTIYDGLPAMEIYNVIQDEKGYIWIGTNSGLSRFNGYQFQNYTTQDGLSNNAIVFLNKDSKDRIWIGSSSNLVYRAQNIFHTIEAEYFSYDPHSIEMVELEDNGFLVSTGRNVYQIDTTNKIRNFRSAPFGDSKINYHFIKGIDNSIWVHAATKLYKIKNGNLVDSLRIDHPLAKGQGFSGVAYKHFLIYNSNSGLLLHDLKNKTSKQICTSLKAIEYLAIYDNVLWIIDREKGIWTKQIGKNGLGGALKQVHKSTKARSVTRDNEGNYWIPTDGEGLLFLSANYERVKLVANKQGLTSNNLSAITSSEAELWLGSKDGLLQYIKEDQILKYRIPGFRAHTPGCVHAMRNLEEGPLLLATESGLFAWIGTQFRSLFTRPSSALFINGKKSVLVATDSGVYEIDYNYLLQKIRAINGRNTAKNLNSFTPITTEASEAVFKDATGQYWCGSTKNGLITINKGSKYYWKEKSPIFASNIVDIKALADGTIAIATQGAGLILVKGDQYFQIDSERGLASDICNDMHAEGQHLWIATNSGITGLQHFDFERKTFKLELYNHLDGLLTNEISAITKMGNRLYGATPDGMMHFDEYEIKQAIKSPNLNITRVLINDRDTLVQPEYVLSSTENNIRINYVGLSFRHKGNLLYKYQLVGVDKDWISTTALETHYSNLAPGTYKFLVATVGNNNLNGDNIVAINFKIKPHFTQTAFFKLFLVLVFIGLVFGLAFVQYTTMRKNELQAKVDSTTKALRQKVLDMKEVNTKLELSNKELEEFAYIASHDLKSPLRNVAGFIQLLERRSSERLTQEDREYIQLAVNGVKHMDNVINDILSMSKVNQQDLKKKNINLDSVVKEIIGDMSHHIQTKQVDIQLTSTLPKVYFSETNAKQLFQNLISNAIKYQNKPQPKVEIGYQTEHNHYCFFVKDNGIGIEPEYKTKIFQMFQRLHSPNRFSGTGIGLSICKKIVEHNKGQIWFESEPGLGTTFYFTLPKSSSN